MSYYRGDYRGDYYRGDPFGLPLIGAVGGFLAKKVVPSIAKRAVGLISRPSTAKAVATAAGGAVVSRYLGPLVQQRAALAPPPGMIPKPGLRGKIQRLLPGGETGYVRRRRMNVTNAKALRRAIRRARGFAKLAKKVLTFVDARAPRGRAKYKVAKRSS